MNELLGRVHFGDAFALMGAFPAAFVDCTVTSVPYWQQRCYLPEGHILKRFEMGTESTIEKYLADMKDLFAQVYRITKPTGSLWLNVGDKTASKETRKLCPGYRDGELLGIPAKLSEALREVGWRRVAEVIWHKTNANPEASARRPTLAHEPVYLFTKGPDAYFDPIAIEEPAAYPNRPRSASANPEDGRDVADARLMRRSRSVWPIPTVSFDGRKVLADFKEDGKYLVRDPECPIHGDHPVVAAGPLFGARVAATCSCRVEDDNFFAAMPPALAERCILASTSEAGNCPACGAPIARVVHKNRVATRSGVGAKHDRSGRARRDPLRHVTYNETIGWKATCAHTPRTPIRPVVFDPFVGSGTTPMVAQALGRDWLGTELNPVCAKKIAPARIASGWARSPVH